MRFTTLLFCMAVAFAAAAQDYPAKPVKMLVPYAPGGATDIIARIVAQRLTESLKESFIVENRPGANGNIALEATAKAAADGYTLLVGNVSTNAINENIYADQLSIRPTRDLVGITKLVEIPHLVVANASVPAKNIAELIALAKKSPGKINYASITIICHDGITCRVIRGDVGKNHIAGRLDVKTDEIESTNVSADHPAAAARQRHAALERGRHVCGQDRLRHRDRSHVGGDRGRHRSSCARECRSLTCPGRCGMPCSRRIPRTLFIQLQLEKPICATRWHRPILVSWHLDYLRNFHDGAN